eukprot:Tbor_TRINITY_DN2065_c0_g1::TRINITY_DN2065_c0_g1_i1::g.12180::m.12180
MASPAPCSAIYVPIELRHEIEAWLVESYNLKLLPAHEVNLPMSSSVPINTLTDSRCQVGSKSGGKFGIFERRAKILGENSLKCRPSYQNLRSSCLSSPKLRSVLPNRRRPSSRGTSRTSNHSDCFKRLYQLKPKAKSLPEVNIKKAASTVSSARSDEVFYRLYRFGMSQKKKLQEKADAKRKIMAQKEEEEMRRGRALAKLRRACEGHGISPKELTDKEMDFKETRLSKSAVLLMSKRLSAHHVSSPKRETAEERECTFHPKTNNPVKFNLEEHNNRFETLYKDSKRKLRLIGELAEKQLFREKQAIVDHRLEYDIAFRRRVNQNPAVADEFMQELK